MKRLFTALTVSFILLAVPGLLAAKSSKKPVFDSTSTASYEGACKSAVVQCTFQSATGVQKVNMVKKNRGNSKNVEVTFSNLSGMTMDGTISFDEGLWLSFTGPVMAPSANKFVGQVPVSGAARLSGDVTYDLDAKTFAGSGEIVTFEGSMELKALIKSSNDKAMMKVWVYPASTVYNKFENNSSVEQATNLFKVKFPAIQMNRKP